MVLSVMLYSECCIFTCVTLRCAEITYIIRVLNRTDQNTYTPPSGKQALLFAEQIVGQVQNNTQSSVLADRVLRLSGLFIMMD